MADSQVNPSIGFVSGGAGTMPHYNSFLPIVPKKIELDFQGLGLYGDSLYEIADKKAVIVNRLKELTAERHWDGVILTAAPTEVLNPGLYEDLKSSLSIPFTTALHACVIALGTYGATRVLLLTPFDSRLNQLIVEHLKRAKLTAVSPHSFDELTIPKRMTPDEVFALAEKSLSAAGDVDAIYFQGAVLDPIKCLERIETTFKKTVIASNPAMLWYLCSELGIKHSIQGYGRLLREWPALPN